MAAENVSAQDMLTRCRRPNSLCIGNVYRLLGTISKLSETLPLIVTVATKGHRGHNTPLMRPNSGQLL